jgi:hypothetical protein
MMDIQASLEQMWRRKTRELIDAAKAEILAALPDAFRGGKVSGGSIGGTIPLASVPAHKTTHQNGGADEISVAGLSGLLADAQTPAAHSHDYEAAGAVATHEGAADPHTGYQKESEKGSANGYASLGADGKVPSAQLPAGSGGMDNPMTTAGDIIVGGTDGVPARLAKGTDGQVLKMASGAVAWGADSTGGGGGAAFQTLTDGATIAWDLSAGSAVVTLGGNRTLANPTNIEAGAHYHLVVIQDGTGSRKLSYGTAYYFPSGYGPNLTSTAGAVDVLHFVASSNTLYCVGTLKALATWNSNLVTYGETDLTPGKTYAAISSYGSRTPDKAFNDNYSNDDNSWHTNGVVSNVWLSIDFGAGAGKIIGKVTFRNGTPQVANRGFKDSYLQGSNDNSNWTKVAATGATGGPTIQNTDEFQLANAAPATLQTVYFANNITAYRYYRVFATTTWGEPTYVGLAEVEMMEIV